MKEAVRIVDVENSLKEYVKIKYKYNANFVDVEARRTFNSKEVTASVIKCSHSFNHYRVREALINNKLIGDKCP